MNERREMIGQYLSEGDSIRELARRYRVSRKTVNTPVWDLAHNLASGNLESQVALKSVNYVVGRICYPCA
jgi:transposase-like protein